MLIRQFQASDLNEILNLFYQTVHTINLKDYSKEQLDAWASHDIDVERWQKSLTKNYALVAIINDKIVGFGDIDDSGYLDHLYVHKDYQNQHIATKITEQLEKHKNFNKIITHASITALPFFLKQGYQIMKKQQVLRKGVYLTNYVMEKTNNKNDT